MEQTLYDSLARKLKLESNKICSTNHCTLNSHRCNSKAFFDRKGIILNICIAEYFQGSAHPVAIIPLPFYGNGEELQTEVMRQIQKQ